MTNAKTFRSDDARLAGEVRNHDLIREVKLTGRIDSVSTSHFGLFMAELIGEGSKQFILNLAEVSYLASTGLREKVSVLKQLRSMEGDLRIAQPTARTCDVLEMSGLDSLFQIFDTVHEALDSYQNFSPSE